MSCTAPYDLRRRMRGFTLKVQYGRPTGHRFTRWYVELVDHEYGMRENYKFACRPTRKQIKSAYRYMKSCIEDRISWG